jgi:hypothetical protein
MSRARGFDRTPLRPDRVRRIDGSFAFLPHRFLRDGLWAALDHQELLLYVLLVLVADRQGLSFYFDDRLAALLRLRLDEFLTARAGLLRLDLIAYDALGPRYQVLSHTAQPRKTPPPVPPPAAPVPPPAAPVPPPAAPVPPPAGPRTQGPVPVRDLVREVLARLDRSRR